MDPYDSFNRTACLEYCDNDFYNEIRKNLEAPMPWIGMYIAAASAVCSLAMAADVFNGFRSKKMWFPCKYFSLNATSLTLLAVTMKLSVDLTASMMGLDDLVAKVSSLVLMTTAMSNFTTSLASMNNNDILLNLTALGILVFTIAANVCIHNVQVSNYIEGQFVLAEELAAIVFMLLLLVVLCSSSLVVPTAKRNIESKYREMHKIASSEQVETIDEMRLMIQKYWVMAETGSPQFVMARSVISAISGVMCLLMALNLVEAHIRMHVSYRAFGPTMSDYKWSATWILYIQSLGVALGTIAPVFRWFVSAWFKISESGRKSFRDELKMEVYWTLRLVEWRESSLSVQIRHYRCRKLLHDAKKLVLNICNGVQILVVVTSKLVLLISLICANAIFLCFHHIKNLKKNGSQASNETRGEDLSRYVLLLEGESELPKKILTNICNEVDKVIQTGRRTKPKSLIELVCKSENFNGVIQFDDIKDVPSLHSEEPPNCWSLPVVTLTSIAIALPNITDHKVNRLLRGVSEGLYFMKLIDKSLDGDRELANIRNAADVVWVGVELYHKWLDNDIRGKSLEGRSYKHVLQELSDIAEKTVKDFEAGTKDFLSWPVQVIAANSMYRITQTVLIAHKDDNHQTDEEMFERLSVMISDILAACFTNLVHFISSKCHNNQIKNRAKRVRQAALVLGESEEILEILQKRELPSFLDKGKAANIEEWRKAVVEQNNENPLAPVSIVLDG